MKKQGMLIQQHAILSLMFCFGVIQILMLILQSKIHPQIIQSKISGNHHSYGTNKVEDIASMPCYKSD